MGADDLTEKGMVLISKKTVLRPSKILERTISEREFLEEEFFFGE